MKLTSASGLTVLTRECPTRTMWKSCACLHREAPWRMAGKPMISSLSSEINTPEQEEDSMFLSPVLQNFKNYLENV